MCLGNWREFNITRKRALGVEERSRGTKRDEAEEVGGLSLGGPGGPMDGFETGEELYMISSLERLFWLHSGERIGQDKFGIRKIYWESVLLASLREEVTMAWTKELSERWRGK